VSIVPQAVIVSGRRTPIGAFGGVFSDVPAASLAATVLEAAVSDIGLDPGLVEDVVMGQAYQNGECANGARLALLTAGWPDTVPGLTLDRRCCSGIDALGYALMKIQTGAAQVVVAGGMESMSQAEFYVPGAIRWGLGGRMDPKWGFMPRGHGALSTWGLPLFDRIQRARVMSQPLERYGELNSMMVWAETAAKNEGIGREAADRWALRSHQRAVAARSAGKFSGEIAPVSVPQPRGEPRPVDADETPRPDTTLEKLARLRPVYDGGVCTAGNSSSENDGAAACVLMSADRARDLGLEPLVACHTFSVAACDPTLTYPAVPAAVGQALAPLGLTVGDLGLIEIQEAFAVQALADGKLMGLTPDEMEAKVNVNGSGISLGHPIGATGMMRLLTLVREMERRDARWGMVTICGGGGLGVAAVVERRA
jgi:acetyl-CoA C-acetyltransferase